MTNYNPTSSLLGGFQNLVKPKVFVSYHHINDQAYADQFSTIFHQQYQVVTDRSLQDSIDSSHPDYVYQQIREKYITGTSCTVVLCGQETMSRKYIDWEIKATLDKQHGLLGVVLPTHGVDGSGKYIVPTRLHQNIQSGYASWIHWTSNVQEMLGAINAARDRARQTHLIKNSNPMMSRNQ